MTLTRRDVMTLTAGALAAAAWPARTQARPLRMLLNSGYSGANSFFLLAEDRGYLKEAGVSVTFTAGRGAYTAANRMMEEGFDVAYGDVNALIELVSLEPGKSPVGVYMVFNSTPSALVVKADGPIQLPYDLLGRRIVGHATDVALNTFRVYAAHARVDPDEITIDTSEASMEDMLKDLLAGKVDAVFGYASTIRAAATAAKIDAGKQLKLFKYEDLMTEFYGSTVMVSRRLVAESPELLRGMLRAFTRGLRDAILQPDSAIDAVAKRDPKIDRAIERARLQDTLDGEMAHPEGQRIGIGEVDPGRLAANIVQIVETRKLQRVPGILEIFNDEFLPPINERITSLGQ
ncbi:MAG: ABC transporter substrate-binding protein [Acidobacteria bacterium]|nr:ABC transporter substrate-binding protein [Acidobacteriota bacterium]